MEKNEITYYGTGDEIREFIHVRDAADASVKILDPEFENQNIILTGTQTLKYAELLEMINEILSSKVSIKIVPASRKAHYKMTPYNFSPRLGKKFVSNPHIDMGQGLLLCMAEIYKHIHSEKKEQMGLIVGNNDE